MKKYVFENSEQGGALVADEIIKLVNNKPDALLCLAAGHSSLPIFNRLITYHREGMADFSRVKIVGLDEWLGIDPSNEGACCNFLYRSIFTPLGLREEQLCLFNPLCAEPELECKRIEKYIESCGGIDFMLLGLGINGHIGLNEPGDSFSNGAHVVALSKTTKEVSPKYFGKDMPPLEYGITLGISNIIKAKKICLTAFGEHKRDIVRTLLSNEVSEDLPASVLKKYNHAYAVFDSAAYN